MSVTPQLGVQVFDAHPDAHWLLDDRGVLKHANKAALRLMGNLATVPAGEKISNLVVDEATRCEDLIRQGLRSTVSTPARLRLRTGDAAMLVDEPFVTLSAGQDAEVLVFDLEG